MPQNTISIKFPRILLDVGSSTVKCYKYNGSELELFFTRSILFKKNFNSEKGISIQNKNELLELIRSIKEENKNLPIKIYATAFWRGLPFKMRQRFIDEFFEKTGLYFNIIDQDLENFYLEMALVHKCYLVEPILLMNIGGGSTELVVLYKKEAIEKVNVDFGVKHLIDRFPEINKSVAGIKIERVISEIKSRLPILKNRSKIAFYTGGELTYMKLGMYPLVENKIFKDPDHPYLIYTHEFIKKNKEVFERISLEELERMMPHNPKWMRGARACSAIAQAICEHYGISKIIPSDSNIVNGIVRREFRYITISGGFRKHLNHILDIKRLLEKKNIIILSPRFTKPKNPDDTFVLFEGEENSTPLQLERYHLSSIEKSDALIVCDINGYVGASAMLEIGYAYSLGKRIIFIEKPSEFILNKLPAEVGL